MLRDYQARAIAELRQAYTELPEDKRRVVLVAPPGSGKTTVGSEACARKTSYGKRSLWIAHRTELIDQAADRLTEFGLSVGVIAAGSSKAINPHRPVQVASIQTLNARGIYPEADLVVTDECHHTPSKTYQVLHSQYPRAQHLGLTGTPERADGRPLTGFERLIVVAQPSELIAAGYLVPYEVIRPDRTLKPGEIAQRPVDAWAQHAAGQSTLVFSPTIEAAEKHAAEFRDVGVSVAMIEGTTARSERRKAIQAFREGRLKVIVNVGVLTEGTDLPVCSCVILARGCGTAGLYIQIAARAGRPYEDPRTGIKKTQALLIDLRGVSWIHGSPVEDRVYSLAGDVGIRRASEPNPYSACLVCGAPKEPGEPCSECGTAARSVELTVTGDTLSKWDFMRRLPDDKRAKSLRKWLKDARDKGHKEGSALWKYRAVYGGWPPADVLALARQTTNE